MQSHAQVIRKWTKDTGAHCADQPTAMSYDEAKFIIHMVASELVELAQTVCDTNEEAIRLVQDGAHCDLNVEYTRPSDFDLVVEQADALADVMYYIYNAAAKKGYNMDRVIAEVHRANEAKRFPDGTFHRDERGKVIKPSTWTPPDLRVSLCMKQFDE